MKLKHFGKYMVIAAGFFLANPEIKAGPVTYQLNQVGGAAFGSFTYDSSTAAFTAFDTTAFTIAGALTINYLPSSAGPNQPILGTSTFCSQTNTASDFFQALLSPPPGCTGRFSYQGFGYGGDGHPFIASYNFQLGVYVGNGSGASQTGIYASAGADFRDIIIGSEGRLIDFTVSVATPEPGTLSTSLAFFVLFGMPMLAVWKVRAARLRTRTINAC